VEGMDSDLYSFALKSTLDEIRNLLPDISSTFMFTEDGEITASDMNTSEETMVRIIDALDGLLEKAETMGGIELVTIESSKGRANISHMNDQYLVTIANENADENYVNLITRSIVTTVLKLLQKISPAPLKNTPPKIEKEPETSMRDEEEPVEHPVEKPEITEAAQLFKSETVNSEPLANQFMVENVHGLIVAADTVRVDRETLSQWGELFENRKIEEIEIETFGGQSKRCKIKPMTDSKLERKGVIQIPHKIQQSLDVKKGELVKVKPIVEQEGNGT